MQAVSGKRAPSPRREIYRRPFPEESDVPPPGKKKNKVKPTLTLTKKNDIPKKVNKYPNDVDKREEERINKNPPSTEDEVRDKTPAIRTTISDSQSLNGENMSVVSNPSSTPVFEGVKNISPRKSPSGSNSKNNLKDDSSIYSCPHERNFLKDPKQQHLIGPPKRVVKGGGATSRLKSNRRSTPNRIPRGMLTPRTRGHSATPPRRIPPRPDSSAEEDQEEMTANFLLDQLVQERTSVKEMEKKLKEMTEQMEADKKKFKEHQDGYEDTLTQQMKDSDETEEALRATVKELMDVVEVLKVALEEREKEMESTEKDHLDEVKQLNEELQEEKENMTAAEERMYESEKSLNELKDEFEKRLKEKEEALMETTTASKTLEEDFRSKIVSLQKDSSRKESTINILRNDLSLANKRSENLVLENDTTMQSVVSNYKAMEDMLRTTIKEQEADLREQEMESKKTIETLSAEIRHLTEASNGIREDLVRAKMEYEDILADKDQKWKNDINKSSEVQETLKSNIDNLMKDAEQKDEEILALKEKTDSLLEELSKTEAEYQTSLAEKEEQMKILSTEKSELYTRSQSQIMQLTETISEKENEVVNLFHAQDELRMTLEQSQAAHIEQLNQSEKALQLEKDKCEGLEDAVRKLSNKLVRSESDARTAVRDMQDEVESVKELMKTKETQMTERLDLVKKDNDKLHGTIENLEKIMDEREKKSNDVIEGLKGELLEEQRCRKEMEVHFQEYRDSEEEAKASLVSKIQEQDQKEVETNTTIENLQYELKMANGRYEKVKDALGGGEDAEEGDQPSMQKLMRTTVLDLTVETLQEELALTKERLADAKEMLKDNAVLLDSAREAIGSARSVAEKDERISELEDEVKKLKDEEKRKNDVVMQCLQDAKSLMLTARMNGAALSCGTDECSTSEDGGTFPPSDSDESPPFDGSHVETSDEEGEHHHPHHLHIHHHHDGQSDDELAIRDALNEGIPWKGETGLQQMYAQSFQANLSEE